MRRAARTWLRALALRVLGLDPRRRRGWHRAQAAEALRDARLHAAVRQMGHEAAWLARTAGRIRKAGL